VLCNFIVAMFREVLLKDVLNRTVKQLFDNQCNCIVVILREVL